MILAGGVARGAFEAGALKVLADHDVHVIRLVAASSGALNGTLFASAIRARRAREGAQELVRLWREQGSWIDVFHCNPAHIARRRGISDTSRLRRLLRQHVRPVEVADPAPINLRIIVSPLEGVVGTIGDCPATSHEQMLEFDGVDFDSAAALERVFTAAVASSSLPLLFTPTHVPGLGDCVDGGAVNNNPIAYAQDGLLGLELDAVVLISPIAALRGISGRELRGVRLVGQLIETLINERLYRDLRANAELKQTAARLAALSPELLAPTQLAAVQQALGWRSTDALEVVPIRPLESLPGSAFSGFFRPDEREKLIEMGITRARQVLREHGWD